MMILFLLGVEDGEETKDEERILKSKRESALK